VKAQGTSGVDWWNGAALFALRINGFHNVKGSYNLITVHFYIVIINKASKVNR
jgi:hypothetical protein